MDNVKKGVPSDKELEEVAVEIGDAWKKLGRRLKFEEANLTGFHKQNEDYSEKAYQMLLAWKRRYSGDASYRVLQVALCHRLVGRQDLATKFCCDKVTGVQSGEHVSSASETASLPQYAEVQSGEHIASSPSGTASLPQYAVTGVQSDERVSSASETASLPQYAVTGVQSGEHVSSPSGTASLPQYAGFQSNEHVSSPSGTASQPQYAGVQSGEHVFSITETASQPQYAGVQSGEHISSPSGTASQPQYAGVQSGEHVSSPSGTASQPQYAVPPEILARGPSAVEAYNKALAEGKTRVKRVPVMLIGQDRSGKTSIKKSLMGKPFYPEEGSTVGVEVDPSYFEVSTEIWKTKQGNEGANSDPGISYEHHVARLIVGSLKKEGTASKDRNARESHSEATEAASDVEGASERNLDLAADVVSHPCSQSAGSQEDDPPLIVPEEVPEDVATLITELLKDVDKVEEEEEVYSVLWDFGGQSVYYATHPLFLTPRAIYLLVWDLSRNLHGRAVPIAKQGMCEELHDTYCGKTNGDFLDLWMSSVASLASQDEVNPESLESKKLPNMLPPVLLVCTHADKPYGNVDSKKLARKIFGFLLGKPYSNHLFEFFALDNTKSGSGQECPETIRLRREVHALAKELPQMKEDIPLKWLKFEKAIRVLSEKGHKWIPLNEARQVADEVCKIVSDEEFSTLLNFLHDQRILMHFSGTPKLNTMVILNLHWLIDVFKKVITVKPYDRKEKEFIDEWNKLEKTGILENKLLEHVWGPLFDQQETAAGLIAIMEKFSLLCPWPFPKGSQQYLVPSMLMSHPTDGVLNLLASARVASLFVKFDSGQVPQGLFPRLVLQFFQWCTEEWSSQLQPELFHNFARFYTRPEEGCSVILLCHSTSIEIVVHGGSRVRHHSDDLAGNVQSKMTLNEEFRHDTSDVITCRSVRRQLGLILNSMREEFWWLKHVKCEMCVCCTVCCHSGSMKYCRTHIKEGCKQEECLHFLSESELRNSHQPIFCNKNAVAKDNKIQVQQFAPWFSFLDEQNEAGDLDERAERLFLATAGHDEQFALALPSGVLETLQSKTSDAKEVVVQLQESLQLDRAALEQPKPETKHLIRCLANKAKCANRLDVVRHLRTITPAGTTGPLLPEDHDVRNIPVRQRKDLTINLCGEDEWKVVAESLGLTPAEIRYLDNRTINPADAALAHIGNQYYTSVGNLYDVLVDCEMPQYADFL